MPKRIMTVEDSPSFRIAVVTSLSNAGYDVVEASDGHDALAKLNDQSVDMLIVDVVMPGMDGIELVKLVRTESDYMDVPIIMLTNQSEMIQKEIMRDAGATAWMAKPFKMTDLIATVEKAFG